MSEETRGQLVSANKRLSTCQEKLLSPETQSRAERRRLRTEWERLDTVVRQISAKLQAERRVRFPADDASGVDARSPSIVVHDDAIRIEPSSAVNEIVRQKRRYQQRRRHCRSSQSDSEGSWDPCIDDTPQKHPDNDSESSFDPGAAEDESTTEDTFSRPAAFSMLRLELPMDEGAPVGRAHEVAAVFLPLPLSCVWM